MTKKLQAIWVAVRNDGRNWRVPIGPNDRASVREAAKILSAGELLEYKWEAIRFVPARYPHAKGSARG